MKKKPFNEKKADELRMKKTAVCVPFQPSPDLQEIILKSANESMKASNYQEAQLLEIEHP